MAKEKDRVQAEAERLAEEFLQEVSNSRIDNAWGSYATVAAILIGRGVAEAASASPILTLHARDLEENGRRYGDAFQMESTC